MESYKSHLSYYGPPKIHCAAALFGIIVAWLIGMGFGYIIWS